VEVAVAEDFVLVRDAKDRGSGSVLRFTHSEWSAFAQAMRDGEFDRD
jgi:hypothetical protein